jgi:hypothetical protein
MTNGTLNVERRIHRNLRPHPDGSAGHKFSIDLVVDYVPKGALKFSVPRGAYKITKFVVPRASSLCAPSCRNETASCNIGSKPQPKITNALEQTGCALTTAKASQLGAVVASCWLEHGPKRAFGIAMASNNQAYHVLGACPIQ